MSKLNGKQQIAFHVSLGGSDRNPGTLEQPFETIERAQEAVRLINKDMQEDIIVYIRGGRYYLNSTKFESGNWKD